MQNNKLNSNYYDILRQNYQLSQDKIDLFYKYTELLHQATCNVTTIHEVPEIIQYHFADSLELGKVIPITNHTIVDVGTGGGFPGIPLKIAYPQCTMILIEVVAKKREFLKHIVTFLNLENIIIEEKDWRTFLRTTRYPADIVCARASLSPHELLRMLQPCSPYNKSSLVYWASSHWKPSQQEQIFLQKLHNYQVGTRERKLAFFSNLHKI